MRLGELGFVWERCEDKEDPGSCEGAGIIGRVIELGPRAWVYLALPGGPSLERKDREARGSG